MNNKDQISNIDTKLKEFHITQRLESLEFLSGNQLNIVNNRLSKKFAKHNNQFGFKSEQEFADSIKETFEISLIGDPHLLILCTNVGDWLEFNILNLLDGSITSFSQNLKPNSEVYFVTFFQKRYKIFF